MKQNSGYSEIELDCDDEFKIVSTRQNLGQFTKWKGTMEHQSKCTLTAANKKKKSGLEQ